jgi:hypothetical protein
MKLKGLILAVCIYASSIFSYSYTAFPASTGEEKFVLNPYFYANGSAGYGSELFLAYGITSKLDIWSDVSLFQTEGMTTTDFSTMLRYDIESSNILAVRISPWYVSPQYHLTVENDAFAFQANVTVQVAYEYYKKPAFYGILCPVIKLFGGDMDIFVEVNPGYYMMDNDFANLWKRPKGFGLDIVPGIGFGIRETLFSISCPIYDVTNNATPTFGMWWCFPISSK